MTAGRTEALRGDGMLRHPDPQPTYWLWQLVLAPLIVIAMYVVVLGWGP